MAESYGVDTRADALFETGTYAEAVAFAVELAATAGQLGPIALTDRIDLALALAEEQAARGHLQLAIATLEAALEDFSDAGLWLSDTALTVRAGVVRLLDRLAALHLEAGDALMAFLRSSHAAGLSTDFGEDAADARRDRARLMREAAQLTGRADFEAEAAAHWPQADMAEAAETFEEDHGFESVRRAPGQRRADRSPDDNPDAYHEVPIFYATHRDRTGRNDPYDFYRGKRSAISFGKAIVTVPKDRESGDFNIASRRSARSADKAKLITIDTISLLESRSDFTAAVAAEIAESERKEALVFIHGFNTSFAGAIMRAGQLAVDLDIDGATVAYSWPSQGSVLSYVVDRNQIIDTFLEGLKDVIVDVALKTGAQRVHLLGHSMGCQFLLNTLIQALLDDTVRDLGRPLVNEVIFASPDVDAEDFVGKIGRVQRLADRITVYTSREDRALQTSSVLQGGRRAGQSPEIVARAGVDAIDTTAAEQDFLGHTDYAQSALDDVRAVVWLPVRVPPAKRAAILRPDEAEPFWHYKGKAAGPVALPFRKALELARRFGPANALVQAAGGAVTIAGAGIDEVREQLESLIS